MFQGAAHSSRSPPRRQLVAGGIAGYFLLLERNAFAVEPARRKP